MRCSFTLVSTGDEGKIMRTLGTLSILGALAVAVGCGSSSDGNTGTTNGGTSASMGGTSAAGGATGGTSATVTGGSISAGGNGGAASTETCNIPACLANIMAGCMPSGNCTQATDASGVTNKCYDNGVKTGTSITIATMGFTMTAKNATSTCYSVEGTISALTFKDGSGTVVGTGSADMGTGTVTVTCTGGQPVALNSGCDSVTSALNPLGGTTCTAGSCTF